MVKFYMLIGLPGSGKSEIARQLADGNTIVLSSDAIRKEFYGDETIQDDPAKVFEEMQRRTIAALKDGKNVVYDATNISRKKRKHLLSSITIPCQKIAYVIWARYETCLARDNSRNRNVGESVIRRMLLNFQPPYYDEGWDDIEFRLNDEPYRRSDYDTKVQTLDIQDAAYSKDAQTMDLTMTVQYQIDTAKVKEIATTYGSLDALSSRIRSVSIERAKSVLSNYSAMTIRVVDKTRLKKKLGEVVNRSKIEDINKKLMISIGIGV